MAAPLVQPDQPVAILEADCRLVVGPPGAALGAKPQGIASKELRDPEVVIESEFAALT